MRSVYSPQPIDNKLCIESGRLAARRTACLLFSGEKCKSNAICYTCRRPAGSMTWRAGRTQAPLTTSTEDATAHRGPICRHGLASAAMPGDRWLTSYVRRWLLRPAARIICSRPTPRRPVAAAAPSIESHTKNKLSCCGELRVGRHSQIQIQLSTSPPRSHRCWDTSGRPGSSTTHFSVVADGLCRWGAPWLQLCCLL